MDVWVEIRTTNDIISEELMDLLYDNQMGVRDKKFVVFDYNLFFEDLVCLYKHDSKYLLSFLKYKNYIYLPFKYRLFYF
jgi:hypothetical protein